MIWVLESFLILIINFTVPFLGSHDEKKESFAKFAKTILCQKFGLPMILLNDSLSAETMKLAKSIY